MKAMKTQQIQEIQRQLQTRIPPSIPALHAAILTKMPLASLNELLNNETLNAQDSRGRSPLYIAVITRQPEIIRLLLAHGAEQQADVDGYTPLHQAMLKGDVPTLKALLEGTLTWEVLTRAAETPLHLAAQYASLTIQELIPSCALMDALLMQCDERGYMVLQCAALNADVAVLQYWVTLFKQKGLCDIGVRTKDGDTLLHLAARSGGKECVRYLCDELRLDAQVRNAADQWPAQVALSVDRPEVALSLAEKLIAKDNLKSGLNFIVKSLI